MQRFLYWPALLLGLALLPEARAYTIVSGNVSGQTWGAGTYHVVGNLQVDDETTLNLEPGAVLKFSPGTQLLVYGTLNAPGLSDQPVVLTSSNDDFTGETIDGSTGSPMSGDWKGLYCYGYSGYDGIISMQHGKVLYGGSAEAEGSSAVYLYYSDSALLETTVVAQSGQWGINSLNCSPVLSGCLLDANTSGGMTSGGGAPELVNNTFTNNGGWAVVLASASLTAYSGNTGSANGFNGLGLLNGTLNTSASWTQADPSFPFILVGTVNIVDEVSLTLPAGTLVKAADQALLLVNGNLYCTGSSGNEVQFVSLKDDSQGGDTNGDGPSQGFPGDWLGIKGYGYSGANGILALDWTVIRHAGGTTGSTGGVFASYSDDTQLSHCTIGQCSASGIVMEYCSPVLVDCLLEQNLGHGLDGYGNGPTVLTDNHFNQNGGWGAQLVSSTLTDYNGNTGTGNGMNGLALNGTVTSDRVWNQPDPGFPFVLTGTVVVNDDVSLTLPAGTLVKGADHAMLLVNGSLICPGTEMDPVRLVSLKEDAFGGDTNGDGPSSGSPGDWLGVKCYGYTYFDGIADLDWTIIQHGGGSSGSQGGLYLSYCDWAQLDDCTFQSCSSSGSVVEYCSPVFERCLFNDNRGHGLYAGNSTATQLTDNTFDGNTGWGALLSSVTLLDYSGNMGTGNGINGFGLSGTVSANRIWNEVSPSFPFVLTGSTLVNDDASLTLPAGTLLKCMSNGQLLVYGSLICPGTPEAPVQLVSFRDDSQGGDTNGDGPSSGSPGNWLGVTCYGYSSNDGIADLDHTVIRHAGGATGGQAGLRLQYCDTATFEDCTIGQCSSNGISVEYCSPAFTRCLSEYNLASGLTATGSACDLLDNHFEHNTSWGVWLDAATLTDYSGNTGVGNGVNGLGLRGTVHNDRTWQNPDASFPFILTGTVTVDAGVSLNLAPGLVCKSQPTGLIYVFGTLNAGGQASAPVHLTSLQDDSVGGDTGGDGAINPMPGDWKGVTLNGYSSNDGIGNLNWCYIDFAGNGQSALQAQYCDALNINESRLLFSASHGLRADNCSFSLGGSLIAANLGNGIFHNGNTANLGSCSGNGGGNCILANQGYALYNNTSNPIEACGNFWGSADESSIDAMIFDDDEVQTLGAVDFSGFNTNGCAPVITSITAVNDVVTLEWLPVAGASGYIVYSSATPWGTFTEDTSGVYMGTQWMAPRPSDLHCYRITAILE